MAVETLTALLDRAVARAPHAPAATDARGTLDWAGLAAAATGYAGLLARCGVGPGGRVALWLPNSVDYLALIFACARLGAVAVHVNTRFGAAEVGFLLRRSRASVLVTAWGFAPVDFAGVLAGVAPDDRQVLGTIVGRNPVVASHLGLPVVPLSPADAAPDRSAPDLPCLTFTTSGTTRGPKLVLHAQRSIATHAQDVARAVGLDRAGAAALHAIPLCGTYGLAFAMGCVAGGATIHFMDQFDPAKAEALIRSRRITHLAGGDDMLGRIAQAAGGRPFETLVFSAFARFSPTAAASIAQAQALGMAPCGVYGSSEVQALFAIAPDARRTTDGGDPVSPLARVSVRDPETGAPAAAGEDGELCLSAPSAFLGYLDDPEATAKAFTSDGLFRTGDLASATPTGFVFKSRIGDTLRLGGFLVNPEEIEGYLQTLAGVAEAQVVAVERGGARVAFAFVRTTGDGAFDEPTALAACRASLARYKQPARILPIDAFPVTDGPNGVKIQRAKLREMAQAALERETPAPSA